MLGYLVDLAVQMERDADRPEAEVHRRDRLLLARQPGGEGGGAGKADLSTDGELRRGRLEACPTRVVPRDRRATLQGWIEALRAAGEALPGVGVSAAYRLLVAALMGTGLVVGWSVAAVVFRYDGSRPVNVVEVLAVFVVAQLALLMLLGIVLTPSRWLRLLPGALTVQEALAWFSPGQALRLLQRRLPPGVRELVARTGRPLASGLPGLGTVRKWAGTFAAQGFAVAFNVGALAGCLYLVTFSDLAFAWSTTLEPSVERVHRWTGWAATLWGWWLPEAVPSPELIRETLFYRRDAVPLAIAAGRWGGWWPFLVACMITYGALPRVVLLAVAGWRFRVAMRRALLEAPGVALVLDRLESVWVATQATGTETEPEPVREGGPAEQGEDMRVAPRRLTLVNWGGLALEEARVRERIAADWRCEVLGTETAGGSASIEADAAVVTALAQTPEDSGVALLVKGWEPPLLELLDFLRDLRRAAGNRRILVVVPLGLAGEEGGSWQPLPAAELERWRRRLRSLGDPGLVVRSWPERPAALAAPGGGA
ncbi:MAG: DUF2868 domain-containing protein [Verrucomicrobiales bacterium]|nr:DUF2868 domain-containing protein [Verrucomicrobiales bacterium]